jgi:drug/metabolite transporter (DMT)-like permease
VVLCLLGVFLILGLDVKDWAKGDLYGLICGVLASLSIMSLRAARKEDDSDTILFYVMLFGSIGLSPFLELPKQASQFAIIVFFAVSLAGVLGQAFLTFSYRYVSAISGAITGSTRILFSAILGLSFFGEELSLTLIIGAVCIIASVYFLQTKKAST